MSEVRKFESMTAQDEVRRELIALWDAWIDAIVANDAEQIGSFITEDWVIVGETGITDRKQFLSAVQSGDLTHEAMARVSDPRVEMYGDTAVMTLRVTNSGHYKGQPFSFNEWTSDVYLKRDGLWLCALSHITAASN